MKAFLILVAIIAVLTVAVIICIHIIKKQSEEKKRLKNDIETQQSNILWMYRHASEIAEIDKDRKVHDKKIGEAKTDEEIFAIINTVINSNNDRVRDKAEK